jgi:hypothetical protein
LVYLSRFYGSNNNNKILELLCISALKRAGMKSGQVVLDQIDFGELVQSLEGLWVELGQAAMVQAYALQACESMEKSGRELFDPDVVEPQRGQGGLEANEGVDVEVEGG